MENNNNLTFDEAQTLVCYILMTTNWRHGEVEAWSKLVEEKKEDGTPLFKNAASNAQYFSELDHKLEVIKNKLDNIF